MGEGEGVEGEGAGRWCGVAGIWYAALAPRPRDAPPSRCSTRAPQPPGAPLPKSSQKSRMMREFAKEDEYMSPVCMGRPRDWNTRSCRVGRSPRPDDLPPTHHQRSTAHTMKPMPRVVSRMATHRSPAAPGGSRQGVGAGQEGPAAGGHDMGAAAIARRKHSRAPLPARCAQVNASMKAHRLVAGCAAEIKMRTPVLLVGKVNTAPACAGASAAQRRLQQQTPRAAAARCRGRLASWATTCQPGTGASSPEAESIAVGLPPGALCSRACLSQPCRRGHLDPSETPSCGGAGSSAARSGPQ